MRSFRDLPLSKDLAARFLPFIVGLMVYLGSLFCVFTFFVIDAAESWQSQLTTHLTIEIPTDSKNSSDELQARVLRLLNKTPGIKQVVPVPPQELTTLLHSLMGTAESLEGITLPVLIDVTLMETEPVDIKNLEAHFKTMSPQIQLIDHRDWQKQVLTLIRASVILTSILTGLILLTALIATRFAVRTSLLIHRQVIDILHLIGATNKYIARQFQIHILKQGLLASGLGSSLAFLTFWGLMTLLQEIGISFGFGDFFLLQAFCVFSLAPFVTSFFMMLSARRTVMRGLRP